MLPGHRGESPRRYFTIAIAWAERCAILRFAMSHKNKCAIEAKLPLGRLAAAEIGLTAKFTRPHGWPLMSGSVVG